MTQATGRPIYPDHFEISIGGYAGPSYRVVWDGSGLQYQAAEDASLREAYERVQRIKPSEAQWRRFWAVMDTVGLWRWKEHYMEPGVMDGTQWEVNIERGGFRVAASGSNQYPGHEEETVEVGQRTRRFKRFTEAVRRLIGERPFS